MLAYPVLRQRQADSGAHRMAQPDGCGNLREQRNERTRECLFPFVFMQIKKVGGGSSSVSSQIEEHAKTYRQFLKKQIALYRPHLIIGCGLGGGLPARLLNKYVLPPFVGNERHTGGFAWWRFSDSARPVALLSLIIPPLVTRVSRSTAILLPPCAR